MWDGKAVEIMARRKVVVQYLHGSTLHLASTLSASYGLLVPVSLLVLTKDEFQTTGGIRPSALTVGTWKSDPALTDVPGTLLQALSLIHI